MGRPRLNAVTLDAVRSASCALDRHHRLKRATIGQSFQTGVHLNNIGCLATLLLPYIRSTEVPFSLLHTLSNGSAHTFDARREACYVDSDRHTRSVGIQRAMEERKCDCCPGHPEHRPEEGHCYGLHEHGRAVDDRRSWQLSEHALRKLNQTSSLDQELTRTG